MILADHEIRPLALNGMIEPFSEARSGGVISYGLSSYGYDFRVSNQWKVFVRENSSIVDPKHLQKDTFVDLTADECIIPPNSFVLAKTVERWKIPRDIMTLCIGKSTYARCGIILNCTPAEPEWEGVLTLEISNTSPLPAKIYANEGIGQMLFFKSSSVCETSYADKKGKYQSQTGITLPTVQ